MMTKQAILEHVLDMWLTTKQMDSIRIQWHAFFADPLKYKDTVVPDMVKQYLSETENNSEPDEEIPSDLDEFMTYNGVSWSDFK